MVFTAKVDDSALKLLKSKQDELKAAQEDHAKEMREARKDMQDARRNAEKLGLQLREMMDRLQMLEANQKKRGTEITEKSTSETNPVQKFVTRISDSSTMSVPGPHPFASEHPSGSQKEDFHGDVPVSFEARPSTTVVSRASMMSSEEHGGAGGVPTLKADIGRLPLHR